MKSCNKLGKMLIFLSTIRPSGSPEGSFLNKGFNPATGVFIKNPGFK